MKRSTLLVGVLAVVLMLLAGCNGLTPEEVTGAKAEIAKTRETLVTNATAAQQKYAEDQAIAATQPATAPIQQTVANDKAAVDAWVNSLLAFDKSRPLMERVIDVQAAPTPETVGAAGQEVLAFIPEPYRSYGDIALKLGLGAWGVWATMGKKKAKTETKNTANAVTSAVKSGKLVPQAGAAAEVNAHPIPENPAVNDMIDAFSLAAKEALIPPTK